MIIILFQDENWTNEVIVYCKNTQKWSLDQLPEMKGNIDAC